jgi:hypothetical protein
VQVLAQTARRTMVDSGNYLKAGLYRDGSHTNTQVLMYDHITVASTATVGTPGAGVTGAFTSTLADQCAVFAAVLEAPAAEQSVLLSTIPSTFTLGTITPTRSGPPQTVTFPTINMPIKMNRIRPTLGPSPLTVLLREIPPRG